MSSRYGVFKLISSLPNSPSKQILTPASSNIVFQKSFASSKPKHPHQHHKNLSPTIALFTNDHKSLDIPHSKNPLKPYPTLLTHFNSENRPLAILLCWLMAKNNAISKYAQFYLDQGFDVLTVKITPWQLLWPSTCAPVIENQLLPILASSHHTQKVVHGFSVGGYIFGQLLKAFTHESTKYEKLSSSVKAQIWDSVVDVNGTAVGVSKSVFMTSPTGQKSLEAYINFHLKLFYSVATKYYDESHEYFYNHPLKAPALFLSSKVDPISTIDKIIEVQKYWRAAGISCSQKVWDNTQHVGHMQRYPEEYKEIIRSFLHGSISGIKKQKRRAKVEFDEIIDLNPGTGNVVKPIMS